MNRGPGWWGESYRHSLASRGIQTGDIYVGVHKRMGGLDRDMFNRYQPVEGEIYSLKLLAEMMDVFDKRSVSYNAPVSHTESPALFALIQEAMNRIEPEYITHDEFVEAEFESIYKDIQNYKLIGKQYKLMMAMNRILFVLHRSPVALIHFLGRDVPESVWMKCQTMTSEIETDRFWSSPECIMEFEEIMDDDMVGWFVVQSALELQRTSILESVGEGEGQKVIRSWIEELDRRRLT